MTTYYQILEVAPDASAEEIEAAYQRQFERYDPQRVADLDSELLEVAQQRLNELQRAYQILADPQRRSQYDYSLSEKPARPVAARPEARTLTNSERWYAIGGVGLAILVIVAIWVLTGRDNEPSLRAMGEITRPAPVMMMNTLDGETINLGYAQGQVTLVNFWGTWCEPCIRELPALQQAHEDLSDQGLLIVGVNLTDGEIAEYGNDISAIAAFLEEYGVTYPIALDYEGEATKAYRVFPLPTSFFIDTQGQIRYVHVGELTYDDVVGRFNQLWQEAEVLSQQ